MTDQNRTAMPSGISKHLHSSHPDAIVNESLYSTDKSSKNPEESYQTLEGRTVPGHTDQKINPFNVKGVPGCKACGGSGWKDSAKHPHPCNECAKKTVPNIDTYLTKVGQTSTPVRDDVVVEKTIPVTEYVDQQKQVQVTNQMEVTKTVPVTSNVQVVENVPTRREYEITREEERTREIPVTSQVPYCEDCHVKQKVPRTTNEDITREVPVTRYREETTTIPMKSTVPYQGEREITREIPLSHHTTIDQTPYRENIHMIEMAEGTRVNPYSSYSDVNKEIPSQSSITYQAMGGQNVSTVPFKGLPDCKYCHGDGIRKSKLTGKPKPCKHCVKATGNCPSCGNTGWRYDLNKKCKCPYAK